MPSTIITCKFCGTKNRIPLDRINQRAKCGSCGQFISGTAGSSDLCSLCQGNASKGVHLSNGRIVHESCLKSLQDRKEEIEAKIIGKQREINHIQQEIEKRNSIAFKVKSLFSKPLSEVKELHDSISQIRSDIEGLSSQLTRTKQKLFSIYDFFLSYPPDWDERRGLLVSTKGNHCSNCGSASRLHVHHIKPLSKGGSNELSNLELLCETCHSDEHGGKEFSGEFSHNETAFSKRVQDIRYAINDGKRIKFEYRKPTDKCFKQRTLHPAMLIDVKHHRDSGSTLCVRGYCELRNTERTFALKRMKGLKVL
ncbi:WYL domain-containing protein [Desulfonatronum sp. SC1]|uniref:WYL domain-containing protein n=1 Tax=Desulfonatronum sp. SC1 TaxID=2109626 RepID=UPI001304F718|nr:WYL domain-containing protein [Desulfonatronum sp. SC1]